jgi:hypothetical protein
MPGGRRRPRCCRERALCTSWERSAQARGLVGPFRVPGMSAGTEALKGTPMSCWACQAGVLTWPRDVFMRSASGRSCGRDGAGPVDHDAADVKDDGIDRSKASSASPSSSAGLAPSSRRRRPRLIGRRHVPLGLPQFL